MGVYQRSGSDILCYDFFDANGKRQQISSRPKDGSHPGFRVGQEKDAEAALAIILRSIEAERELAKRGDIEPTAVGKGITYGIWARVWLKRRAAHTPQRAKEDKWKLERHILPVFEHAKLEDLRPRHCRSFVLEMKSRKLEDGTLALAPRSIRAIWSTLRTSLHDALAEEVISQDPCILKDGDLPPVEDADPEWRKTAIYSRAEVVELISEERIPFYRRVRNGILFLAGLRPSESFALRIRHYDRATEHLGQLDLMRAFNTAMGEEKGLKVAAKRRLVPVHPALASLLGQWLLSGWEAHVGRKPTPDDLLIPNEKGTHLRVDTAYDEMLDDQVALGWRKRRLYDSRRTFISLARADKFDRDTLRWMTHGPEAGKILDVYTEWPWEECCVEMLKLKVAVRVTGRILELRRTADGATCDSHCDSREEGAAKSMDSESRHPDLNRRPTDYEGVLESGRPRTRVVNREDSSGVAVTRASVRTPNSGSPVTLSHKAVAGLLKEAADSWEASHDRDRLRQKLAALLSALEAET